MIRFSIGISLVILSLIIGASQYFDNITKLENAENRYQKTQRQVRKQGQFSERLERAKRFMITKGDDQRARIEQTLGLESLGVNFRFTSNVRGEEADKQLLYRHEFEITGALNYFDAFRLLSTLGATSGFVLSYFCFRCDNTTQPKNTNAHSLKIRGFINVFNPERA